MSLDIEPIKSRSYTAEQVDRALLVLAINGGNSVKAEAALKAQGQEVPARTLIDWKTDLYPRRYLYIQQNHGRELEDVLVAQQRELALSASLKALEGIQGIDLDRIDMRDKAKTVQALQTSAAIATDKVLTLTGRPTNVTVTADATAVLKKWGGRMWREGDNSTSEPSATPGELMRGSTSPNAHE